MDSGLKQRLIGAAVLVALAVIFLPMLVQGPAPDSGVSDVPLQMPDAPKGEYETRDLPLVMPGATPNGGAVGLDTTAPSKNNATPIPESDAAATEPQSVVAEPAQSSVSQAVPLGESGVSAPVALPSESAAAKPAAEKPAEVKSTQTKPATEKPVTAKAEPMLPATTAGGNYVVHFGSYAGVAGADAVVKMAKAAQLPAYREAAMLNGKSVQRVRIGPFATRAEAEAARLRAAQVRGDVPIRVVALDAEAAATKSAMPATESKPAATATPTQTAALQPKPQTPAAKPAAAANVGFAVQLGAFGNAADATALRDRLRASGISAFTEQVNTDKGSLTRVLAGPVLNRADADQLKAQVKSKTGVDGIVRQHP